MRTVFAKTLKKLMKKNKDVIVITADMGYSVLEEIQKEFPKRIINTGITEQNSISLATGLALSGFKVFLYAQAVFITMRCFEQVRLDIAYNQVDVKLIGPTAGLSLNQLGVSHFATNDIALMRTLPTMTILSPGDPYEAEWAVNTAYKTKGPVYLRLTNKGSEPIHQHKLSLPLGKSIKIKNGKDASLFVTGGLLKQAVKLFSYLGKKGINISLFSIPTIKPLDCKTILNEAKKTGNIYSLEEHDITGGLGSSIAEILAESNIKANFLRFGIPNHFLSVTGSLDYLLSEECSLSCEKMSQIIISRFKG